MLILDSTRHKKCRNAVLLNNAKMDRYNQKKKRLKYEATDKVLRHSVKGHFKRTNEKNY